MRRRLTPCLLLGSFTEQHLIYDAQTVSLINVYDLNVNACTCRREDGSKERESGGRLDC